MEHRAPLDRAAAAAYLGTSERHIRELTSRHELPYVKVGRLVRFLPEDLDGYLARNHQPAGEA